MSEKMSFGEFIGSAIASNAGAKTVKIYHNYYDTEAIRAAAKQIDAVVFTARMEGRKLSHFETLMIEILLSLASFDNPKEAHNAYQKYLKTDC